MFLPAAGVFPSLRKRLKLIGGEGVGRQWGWRNGRDAQSVLEINRSRIIPVLIAEFLVFENIISRSGTGERRRRGGGGRVRDGIAWSDRTRGNSAIVRRRLAFLPLRNRFCPRATSSLDLSCKRLPGRVVVTVRRTALH